jgi:thiamine kinase-like enzyme
MIDTKVDSFGNIQMASREQIGHSLASSINRSLLLDEFEVHELLSDQYYFTKTRKYKLTSKYKIDKKAYQKTFFIKEFHSDSYLLVEKISSFFYQKLFKNNFKTINIPQIRRFSTTRTNHHLIWMDFIDDAEKIQDKYLRNLLEWYSTYDSSSVEAITGLDFLGKFSSYNRDWIRRARENLSLISMNRNRKEIEVVFSYYRWKKILTLYTNRKKILIKLKKSPCTLLHQDLWEGNLGVANGKLVIFDWDTLCKGPIGADIANYFFMSIQSQMNLDETELFSILEGYASQQRDKSIIDNYYISFCLKPAYSIFVHLLGNVLQKKQNSLFQSDDITKLLCAANQIFNRIEKGICKVQI